MRLRAFVKLALFFTLGATLIAAPADARAHKPQRSQVVSLTTGESTTYVSTRRYKKKKKAKSKKSKKHAKTSKKSKRHPASTKKSKHKAKGKKKHKRH